MSGSEGGVVSKSAIYVLTGRLNKMRRRSRRSRRSKRSRIRRRSRGRRRRRTHVMGQVLAALLVT